MAVLPTFQPGQIIPSNAFNLMVAEINSLSQRVQDLEGGGAAGGTVRITGFTPVNQQSAGQMLSIHGQNFVFPAAGNTVTIDSVPVPNLNFQPGSTTIQLDLVIPPIPGLPAGGRNVTVRVTNINGSAQALYLVLPPIPVVGLPPTLDAITRSADGTPTLRVQEEATIAGTNFSATPADNRLKLRVPIGVGVFANYPAAAGTFLPIKTATPVQLTFDVPDIVEILPGTNRQVLVDLSLGAHPQVTRQVTVRRP